MTMEININCDLGEKSKHHSNKHDPELLEIVNSANIACGYHAGDEETMSQVIEISKKNGVSIGAHPSFNDPENFGRERMNLSDPEIEKLIIDQYDILQKIASEQGENVTHIKPHGALNNMACENIDLATTLAKSIKGINKDLIDVIVSDKKFTTSPAVKLIEKIDKNDMIVDIGPQSRMLFYNEVLKTNTLLWNGPLGLFEQKPFDEGTDYVLGAVKSNKNKNFFSVAGGGDTTSALKNAGVVNDFTYVSSAGGAFLEWLEGIELPAISVLSKN